MKKDKLNSLQIWKVYNIYMCSLAPNCLKPRIFFIFKLIMLTCVYIYVIYCGNYP